MQYFMQLQKKDLAAFTRNWGWFLAFGIILFALGILAISYATFASVLSVIFFGAILFFGGLVVIIDTFRSWWGHWAGFFVHLITGLLYLGVGSMLMIEPLAGSVSLTLILAIFYIIIGIFRILYPLAIPLPKKGLRIFNGVIALLLGILILAKWPASGLFIIGLFVGIDLLIAGWVYITTSLTARSIRKGL